MERIYNYLKLLRIKHYIKNLLIFFPLLFGKMYYDVNNLIICFIGFIIFSIASSIVYIYNDICDIDKDKKHTIKKKRPLAANKITIREAYYLILFLLLVLSAIIYLLLLFNNNIVPILLVFIYFIINILYSKWLKDFVLIDVIILSIGFLIRLYFGAMLINIDVSNWLYLTIMSASFFMGFGKRGNEIIKNERETREVNKYYNKNFLDKSMNVCLTLTIVFYSMWCVDLNVIKNINHDYLIWTVPLVLIILLQYSLTIENDSYGDPVDVLFSNKYIIFTSITYLLSLLFMYI